MTSRWLLSALAALGTCVAQATSGYAQTVELAAQATYLDLDAFDQTSWGFGGRFGWDALPFLMLEAEVNAFPGSQDATGPFVQAMGGVKLGGRARAYGLFVKLRPGFVRFERDFIQPGTACIAVVPTPSECLADRLNLAFDVGTVVEVYPTSRVAIRVDVGTTHIWYGSRGDADSRRYGNFQLGFGAGVRF